jgi:hypothetical protein
MQEKQLQDAVIDLARMYKWKVAHFRPARMKDGGWRTPLQGDASGFPDLVLVRERVVFVELKGPRGKLSETQVQWQHYLLDAGAEWYCWTPREWLDETIQRTLRPAPPAGLEPATLGSVDRSSIR